MAKNYDPNKDYSVAIEEAKASGASQATINQLQQERQNKIDDKYGGKEPTMYGSNTTYSQASKDGDTDSIYNALTLSNQYSGGGSGGGSSGGTDAWTKYAGTNYHQDAIDAAINGDWGAVVDFLNKREEKTMAQGDNRGKTSAQIYAELWDLYGQKTPKMPEYSSQFSSQIDSLLNSILNREEFSYDHTTDPSYLAYAQQYKRLGDRAREDTLGDVASLNGGYASSWATTAASQAQNDYNQQLSGVIPTLYDAAYNRYLNEDSLMRNDLSLLMGVDQTQYDRYRDTVSDSQWKQQFDTSNNQWQQTFDWNKTVDQWNMDNTEATQKFDQLMSKWQLTGVADAEVAAELGVPVGATTESYYFKKANLALDQARLSQSNNGNGGDKADPLAESIARNAKALIDNTESYGEGAKYILSAVTTADEFYTIGSQAGIPTSVLDEVFDSFYDQALRDGNKEPEAEIAQDYAYYAALMGQQPDPEAWLIANQWVIPADILDDLRKLIDY